MTESALDPALRLKDVLEARGIDPAAVFMSFADAGVALVNTAPSKGLLISMLLRQNHGALSPQVSLGPDRGFIVETAQEMQQRVEVQVAEMAKVYDEAVGRGFYVPQREPMYLSMAEQGCDALTLFTIPMPTDDA